MTIYMDVPMMILGLIIMFSNARHWLAIGAFLPQAWKDKLNLIW